jgi:environmental stress-induced protein Ves
MQHRRVGDYRRSRWKNGRGETFEIAISPSLATLDDFDWRISVALLEQDADFSQFAGIDRSLAIIEGAGIDLMAGEGTHRLVQGTKPFRFPGDVSACASLIDGHSLDLNVMTRRDAARHEVRPVTTGDHVRSSADFVALFAPTGATVLLAREPIRLARWDLLELAAGEEASIVSGDALEIRIDRLIPASTS